MELERTDARVLTALLQNSRAPLSSIARDTRLTRQVVEYRTARMLERRLIRGFITQIDQTVFCSGIANVMLEVSRNDDKKFNELLDYLINHPCVNWVSELCGTSDIVFTIFYDSPQFLSETISEIMRVSGGIVKDQDISTYTAETKYDLRGLVTSKQSSRKILLFRGKRNVDIDDIDRLLLRSLAGNARMTVTALASVAGMGEDAVRQRIKRLERDDIILGYTVNFDAIVAGYEHYYVRLQIDQLEKDVTRLREFVRTTKNITFCSEMIGQYNVCLSIAAKSHKQFIDLLLDIRRYFADRLRRYEFHLIVHELKTVFVPEQFLRSHDRGSGGYRDARFSRQGP